MRYHGDYVEAVREIAEAHERDASRPGFRRRGPPWSEVRGTDYCGMRNQLKVGASGLTP